MKRFVAQFALAIVMVISAHTIARAGCCHCQGHGHRCHPHVHVGYIGPYAVYYHGDYGVWSPYRYVYRSDRYPRYYGGEHARNIQDLGYSPADIGIRGRAW